eukprot:1157053-Pelagomonas_calceolata.AAC.5
MRALVPGSTLTLPVQSIYLPDFGLLISFCEHVPSSNDHRSFIQQMVETLPPGYNGVSLLTQDIYPASTTLYSIRHLSLTVNLATITVLQSFKHAVVHHHTVLQSFKHAV